VLVIVTRYLHVSECIACKSILRQIITSQGRTARGQQCLIGSAVTHAPRDPASGLSICHRRRLAYFRNNCVNALQLPAQTIQRDVYGAKGISRLDPSSIAVFLPL